MKLFVEGVDECIALVCGTLDGMLPMERKLVVDEIRRRWCVGCGEAQTKRACQCENDE